MKVLKNLLLIFMISALLPQIQIFAAATENIVYDMSGYTLAFCINTEYKTAVLNGFGTPPEVLTNVCVPEKITYQNSEYTVTEVAACAFDANINGASKKGLKNLLGIFLPKTVTKIGADAFRDCNEMISAKLPGACVIGARAFKSCYRLNDVSFGEGLSALPGEIFRDCRMLQSLVLPSTVTRIDNSAFSLCRMLKNVVILGNNVYVAPFQNVGTALTEGTVFYVRDNDTANNLKNAGAADSDIKVINGKALVLMNGYNNSVYDVIGGEESVTLPQKLKRASERYILSAWSDGLSNYNPGSEYFFRNQSYDILEAKWIKDTKYNKPVSLDEMREAAANPGLTSELAKITDTNKLSDGSVINVSVKESTTVSKINDERLFGVGHEIFDDKLIASNGELTRAYTKAAGNMGKIPVSRWGGDGTNLVNLINNACTPEERTASINLNTGRTVKNGLDYGPVEFIKAALANNPDAEFVFTVSMLTMTPQDTVNFLHFLTDESGEWAEKRKSTGIENPVNVIGFELGNEVYHDVFKTPYVENPEGNTEVNGDLVFYYGTDSVFADNLPLSTGETAERYAETALNHIRAVRKVNTKIELMPVLVNNDVINDDYDVSGVIWNRVIAEKLGKYINSAVLHFYSGTSALAEKAENDVMDRIQQIFREENGFTKKIKFAVTEHALMSSNQQVSFTAMRAVICEGLFMNSMIARDDVLLANYYNFTHTQNWAYIRDIDGEYMPTGIADFYDLYKSMLGDRTVKYTYVNDIDESISPQEETNLAVMAKGSDEITIVITNSVSRAYTEYKNAEYNFTFENEFMPVSKTVFTAPNYFSYKSSAESKDIFTTNTENYDNAQYSNNFSITAAPCSVTFIKLRAKHTIEENPPLPDIPDNAVYKDLLDSAQKNGNIYTFASGEKINRVLYSGDCTNLRISLKNSDGYWENAVCYDDVADGGFINKYSDKYYTAAKIENAKSSDKLCILSEIVGLTDVSAKNIRFRLYPRINGEDCFDDYMPIISDSERLLFSDGEFIILRTGITSINIGKTEVKLNILPDAEKYIYVSNFENGADEWAGDNFSVDRYGNGDKKSVILQTDFAGVDSLAYKTICFNKDRAGLSDRQKIDFSMTRLDSNQHLGIRFMIHNDGKNYYQLEFYRRNGNGYRYPAWVLEKITDGKAVRLKTGYGFGNQSWNTGTVKFSMIIDRGNISWTAKSDIMFDEFCGSFTDSTPFSMAENDATFGFFGYVVKNNIDESYIKNILIDDVTVTGLSCYDSVEHDIFDTESYELSYSLNEDNTLTVDGFMQKPLAACNLVIPSHADTYVDENGQTIKLAEPVRVRNIADEAFFENGTANKQSELIKSVYIENGIQKIGDNAFRNCISIRTARVPGSASLGYGVFKGCMGLESIVLENGITSLPGETFYNCPMLSELTLPESMKNIAVDFRLNQSLKQVAILCDDPVFSGGNFSKTGIACGGTVFYVKSNTIKELLEAKTAKAEGLSLTVMVIDQSAEPEKIIYSDEIINVTNSKFINEICVADAEYETSGKFNGIDLYKYSLFPGDNRISAPIHNNKGLYKIFVFAGSGLIKPLCKAVTVDCTD